MMNLIHWRLLVAVAEAGNITRAAQRCGITQSGASQAIAQMEALLGAALFARERGQVRPTAFGDEVLAHARGMLAELAAIQALAAQARRTPPTRLRLAGFPSSLALLQPRLQAFARRHPQHALVLLEGSDEEIEAWLEAGHVDLGVVLDPAPARKAQPLGCDEWVAVLPAGDAHGDAAAPITLEALLARPFVLATGGCRVNAELLAERAGLRLHDVRMTVRDWASALALVREGVGATLLPASTLPAARAGLHVRPLQPPLHRRFALARSAAAADTPAMRALLAFLAEQ